MRYVVFSIGQFFSSDISTLKTNLTEFYAKYGHSNITGDDIWKFLASVKDESGKTHLHDLRMGGDLFDFWKETIQVQFPINTAGLPEEHELLNEFKVAWNSMCKIKPETVVRVNDFISYLNEHPDTTFVLISHTNHAHFENIQEQIQTHFGDIFPHDQIKFITSMTSQQETHPNTLRYAFENQIILLESGDEVISCLNTIPDDTLSEYVDSSKELSSNFDLTEFESCISTTNLTRR
ncbi:MAG: hypothetical protein P1U74_01960 [Legionellaceae bacterium]|nr:hypothetical protein [Legionellaceae bacterium]